ncbi:ankyrin repeat-containing protein BDA1-like [Corylus avellana]|uniref:ankyrin repeat-containing protein BDA1-like n=1 Tax=Corylus avellana TaxID=13451 RepID=UPI00286A5639|nr:ankyrin repeat-containing protein BDA1-like [Corylus avellana]
MDWSLRDSAEQRNIDRSVRDAAEQGNIDALYVLIEKDAHVLDRVDKIPFLDSFAHSYYILQRKQAILVDRLLDFDKDFVRVRGREGVTPLHYVIQKGDLYFLKKFLEACPESLEDVTIRGENALHIALKYDMIDVFRYLVQWLGRACFKDAKLLQGKLLDGRDDDGNTLLHVAVSRNQPEASSVMVIGSVVHIKNLEGHTVLGILELQSQQTQFYVGIRRRQTVITEERRNALLVVAGLLITVTYPAALSADQPNEFNCTSPSDQRYQCRSLQLHSPVQP